MTIMVMIRFRFTRRQLVRLAIAISTFVSLALPVTMTFLPREAFGGEPPIKEIFKSRIGWEVNQVTKEGICTANQEEEKKCQLATESNEPGGFLHAEGVGGGGSGGGGRIYVADGENHRVQVFAADGTFILTFGHEVNKTTKADVCTRISGDVCGMGVEGTAPGQFTNLQSIAVDRATDDVYVAEIHAGSRRVQKFTGEGQFLLEIGREVNSSPSGNLCTQAEIAKCQGAARTTEGQSSEPGAFVFPSNQGNILAVGGPEHHLYVGDEHTVQEFRANGTWSGEPLAKSEATGKRLEEVSTELHSSVTRIAVDEAGIAFIGYSVGLNPPETVQVFDQTGKELKTFPITEKTGKTYVLGMAVDAEDRLAVIENSNGISHGLLYVYEASSEKLHFLTEFLLRRTSPEINVDAITFNGNDELYGAGDDQREIIAYRPVNVAELLLQPLQPNDCVEGATNETSVTLDCTLNGEVNPWNVPETVTWFKWGSTTDMGQETPKQSIPTGNVAVPVSGPAEDIRPNSLLCVQLVAEDQNVEAPEILSTEQECSITPAVPPRIVGAPSASFIRYSAVVMSGLVNPENASSEYFFEYAPADKTLAERCPNGVRTEPENCEEVSTTTVRESEAYSPIKAIIEAVGLRPNTQYGYRLTAMNNAGKALNEAGKTPLPEGTFTTTSLPVPQATTEQPNAIEATSATIAGSVNADGQPSTYSFEIQVGNGASPAYSTVFTASAGAARETLQKTFTLTGLQPGTEYTYRITTQNGFGQAIGASVSFATRPMVVLRPPEPPLMIETRLAHFPCRPGYKNNIHHKCVHVKKRGGHMTRHHKARHKRRK